MGKIYKFYKSNFNIITKIILYLSTIFNFIYGIFEFGLGLFYKSLWFIILALYYLILWVMKFSLVKEFKKIEKTNEYKLLKKTGIILLFMNFILSGIIILIISQNKVINYSSYLIYLIAIYDFLLIISAFINVFKYRNNNSPILLANKCINLTVAMISIISLEEAMIFKFGNNDTNFKLVMISCTGFGVILINTIMSIMMIKKSNIKRSLYN